MRAPCAPNISQGGACAVHQRNPSPAGLASWRHNAELVVKRASPARTRELGRLQRVPLSISPTGPPSCEGISKPGPWCRYSAEPLVACFFVADARVAQRAEAQLLPLTTCIVALTLQATGPVPRRATTLRNKGVELRWIPGTTVSGNSVRLAALFRFASASGEPHDDKGNIGLS